VHSRCRQGSLILCTRSVETIVDLVDDGGGDADFYIMPSSLHNGLLYTAAGADAGLIQRTCVLNCAKGETGKVGRLLQGVVDYHTVSPVLSFPAVFISLSLLWSMIARRFLCVASHPLIADGPPPPLPPPSTSCIHIHPLQRW
jgi:hypothetical protein